MSVCRKLIVLIVAASALFMSPWICAEQTTAIANSNNAEYLTKVFAGLIAIVGLILAIAWLVKRFGQGTLLASRNLKVIGSLALGVKEKVVIVEVGERQLLLGVTAHNIQTLHKFETPLPVAKSALGKITALGKSKSEDDEDNFDFKAKIQEILSRNCLR